MTRRREDFDYLIERIMALWHKPQRHPADWPVAA
jgi:hypothetical protein